MTGRDLAFLALFGLILLVGLALAWAARARIRGFLSPPEWRLFGKLLAILAFLFLLMLTHIVRELPASLFLYGRF
jgi:hypothetical protein